MIASSHAAFEAIVARHGPMVLGVCRSLLRHSADADDAFQATFLVLVRKAELVRVTDSLGPWLYGVARRVATRARVVAQRTNAREFSNAEAAGATIARADATTLDIQSVVFEELDRLPAKYRSAVILCHFEGLSHEEAARRLGWPIGTLSGRLSRARGLLRSRFTRRGLAFPLAELTWVRGIDPVRAVSRALIRSTVRSAEPVAAGGAIPASLVAFTQGTLIAMTIEKVEIRRHHWLGLYDAGRRHELCHRAIPSSTSGEADG